MTGITGEIDTIESTLSKRIPVKNNKDKDDINKIIQGAITIEKRTDEMLQKKKQYSSDYE